MNYVERRANFARVQLRSAQNSDSIGTVTGYSSVFSRAGERFGLSQDLGGFRERCARGCFSASLRRGDDVKALAQHDPSQVLGRVKNGTLRLYEDDRGLRTEIDLPNTSIGKDTLESVRRGDLNTMSFAFRVDDDGESWDDEADPDDGSQRISVRTLRSVSLLDASIVTYEAYPDTTVGLSDRVDPSLVMGRGLSFEQMFPQGVPVEIRSRVPGIRTVKTSATVERRRKLFNFVSGL